MTNTGNRNRRTRWGLCLLALILSAPAGAQSARDAVVDVRVEGNDRLSTQAVMSYIKTRVGMPYDANIVKDDRDRLMASGRFDSVVATRKRTAQGVIVTFKVEERPTVASIEIVNAKSIPADQLRGELPFGVGDPLNQAAIKAGQQAIINKYRSEGRHFVTVTIDEKALKDKRDVIYTVVEGPKTIVKKVRVEGNHYFNGFIMKLKLQTKAKFWPFIPGTLNTEKIERDVTTIRNMYTADGFLDVEVGRNLDFSDDKTKVDVTFLIKEGPRYRVNEVSFTGNRVFAGDELARRLNLKEGAFYTQEVMRRDIKILENTYGELGYLDAKVDLKKRFMAPNAPVPAWAADVDGGHPALINLVFEIEEKDQYHVGRIIIKGNSITQERVIRREMNVYPEQLVDTVALDLSKSRLQQMRLFEDVTITPVGADEKGVKDVVVDVTEGRTAEFLVGLGVSSNNGLLGTVSFTQRNFDFLAWPKSAQDWLKPETFKGAGQTLSIQAEPGTEMMRFTIGWSTPYLFDQPYRLSLKSYLFTRSFEHYDLTQLGVQASIGHQFKNRWYGQISARVEGDSLDVDQFRAPIEVIEDEDSAILVGLGGQLVRDRTDSRWMPSTGDRFSVGYEQVVGDYSFGSLNASYKIFKTVYTDALDRKHILAGRAAFGQIFGNAPVYEKFYGGGMGSVRGFEYRGISPRGHYAGGAPNSDPIGGDTMFFAGTEYSFPILADKVRGVIFLDSGTVESDFEITTYRVSAGFGFRWTIPLFGPVPMSIDFGFPLVKNEEDDTQIFNFSLGWTF